METNEQKYSGHNSREMHRFRFMKSLHDGSLRGGSSSRRLEDVKKWRQTSGWNDDDFNQNDTDSNRTGTYSIYTTAANKLSSANNWYQSISKPLGLALVCIAMGACLSIACAILRKTHRKKNAVIEEQEDKKSNLLSGRSRTPSREQSEPSSPAGPVSRGRSLTRYGDGASVQSPEISEGYVPMADAYSSKKNPIRAVSKNKDRRVSEQDAARSRSNQRGRAPSQSTKRRI
mmetsp:Transcript_28637/g.41003  ORF Transcript_28637/g.41003 Transcript_28637/m.41003 type:complete len:231 (-) Transcript_28637:205-897(-)|eukprot:CAMPEP_0172423918 /NCGR_PEP_ID=MMETSP1064-20121228/19184_1 /TAXON_ID=202472 /ORGANISM="Aulacoseira subarctica , Strain CCAP 1002/5" /LENGTH=230 /DNA_ID=CAMNT_0013165513 /DNA_START=9 /DNA_END=701 /DNA_ORIENTATION=+